MPTWVSLPREGSATVQPTYLMSEGIDWERLARYVSGEATSAERGEVERWAGTAPENRALLESLAGRWRAARSPDTWNVDAAWARLALRLAEPVAPAAAPDTTVVPIDSRRRRWVPSRLVPLAAAAVLVAGVALVWQRVGNGSRPEPATATLAANSSLVTTAVGERRTIDLPDGSRVVLGAASSLRIDTAFGRPTRHVYLEGQAFFRVTHDAARPFVVHAAGTLAEDLGTEFDVRAYPGDSAVRVAVIEGAVGVRRAQGTDSIALLRPRDVARIDASDGVGGAPVILHDQNVERLIAWTTGAPEFDNATVADVARELERWYDVQVRITSEAAASARYTGPLPVEGIDEAVSVLSLTLKSANVSVQRQGRVVTFSPGSGVGRSTVPPRPSGRVEAGA